MGLLVIRRANTQRRFSTGIQIERADFERLYEDAITSSRCPYCKSEHRWHYRHAEYFRTQSRQRTGLKINRQTPISAIRSAPCSVHKRAILEQKRSQSAIS